LASGNTVYAGGFFLNLGGQVRNYLGAVDATSGLATAWNPNPNYFPADLAMWGNTIYAVGYWGSIGGKGVDPAAIDATTGAVATYTAGVGGGATNSVAVGTNALYVGGFFETVGGSPHIGLDAITQYDDIFHDGF
jgi:hypothetical protein